MGGDKDTQVMAARKNAEAPTLKKIEASEDEKLTDQERRDLEQYAEQEAGLQTEVKEVSGSINRDRHRLERHPEQTIYCLVKRSKDFHEESGRTGDRTYTLIGDEALGIDERGEPEGLHMVHSPLSIRVILLRIGGQPCHLPSSG